MSQPNRWRWPWVSREAYNLALQSIATLQERNDRLVEAVSRSEGKSSVLLPQQPLPLEPSAGWFDTKKFM
jgi:hypothetical protein